MTSDVVETGSPNLLRLLAVIQTMILLIVVVSLIIVEIPDTTATVLVPWTTAIIQAELWRLYPITIMDVSYTIKEAWCKLLGSGGGVKTMSNKKWLRRRTVVIQSALDSPDLGQASKYPEQCHNTFIKNSSGPWSQNLHKKRVKSCQNDRIFWRCLTLHFGKIN